MFVRINGWRAVSGALVAGVSLLALASAARAEDAPPQDAASTTVQDVVVTATRQSTHLQKTPVAVTVVSGSQITQQNIVTTRDLAGQLPGVMLTRSGITPTTQIFFIRGVGDSDPIFDPTVAQYVDDVYLPRAINGMTDLTDIERVEVLRGPQGTLFGENAGGGAIRYITKIPSDKTELRFDLGGGTYNAFNAHFYAAGALVPGQLDGAIAIAHDEHSGYTWDPTLKKYVNNQNTTGGRAKLLWTPTSRFTALFTIDGTSDKSAAAYYTPVSPIIGGSLQSPVYGPYQPNVSYASQPPKNNSWTAGVSLKLSYVIDPHLTINSITAYRGFAQDPVNYNNDGQPLVAFNNANPQLVTISDNWLIYREKEATQEVQLLGDYGRVNFASGLYFLYEDFSSNRLGYVASATGAGAAPAYPEDQIGDTKTTNYAVYAQGNWRITDRLTATLGGRFTLEHRDFDFQGVYDYLPTFPNGVWSYVPWQPIPPVKGGTAAEAFAYANNFSYIGGKSWSAFTPKFSLSYQFTPDIFGYAGVSQGFDAGGYNNRASNLASALPYNQETITAYEGGLKTEWFEHRLRLNATVFYNQFTNLQETASVISPVTNGYVSVRSNAPRAHSDGVEIEAAAQPIDGLTLTGNASYLDTRFDDFPNASYSGGALVPATGNQLPLSPHWQLYGAANWRVPIGALPGTLRIGVDGTYETSYFSDVFNYANGRIPDQGFIDASISYAPAGDHLVFSVTGRNLANKFYFQSLSWGGTRNLWEGAQNPPRTIFFKVAYTL